MADDIKQDRPGHDVTEVGEQESTLQQAKRAMAEGDLDRVEALVGQAVQSENPLPGELQLWVRVAFHQGRLDTALERSAQALQAQPNAVQLHTIDARIQAAAGKPYYALQCVNQAIPRWRNNIQLKLVKLQLLRDLGRIRPALGLVRRLRRRWPKNAAVLLAVAQFYRAHGRVRATRTVLEYVLERHPQHRGAQTMRKNLASPDIFQQAQRAMVEGDLEQAATLVDHAVKWKDAHPGLWHLWIRIAFQQSDIDLALQRSKQALKAHPKDAPIHIIDARMQAAAGKPHHALQCVNHAIPRWPNNVPLKLLKLQLLRDLGHIRTALGLVCRLRRRWPKNAAVLMAIANFYRAHGRVRATRTVLENALEHHPQHRGARTMRQNLAGTSIYNSQARHLSLATLLENARSTSELSAVDAAEILQAVKRSTTPQLNSNCREAIERVHEMADQLTEQDQLVLLNQAERIGHIKATHRALTSIIDNGPRTPPVAQALFQKAMASVEADQVDAVISRLLHHIPQAKQASLRAAFTLHLDGPQCALDQLRQERRQYRSLPEVREMIRFLHSSNSFSKGLRYSRFCRRRWPHDADLRLQHARLLMGAGYPHAVIETLDTYIPAQKRGLCTFLRAHSLLEIGQLHAAKDLLEKTRDKIIDNSNTSMYLDILIIMGREEEAKQLIKDEQRRGQHNLLASGHFSTSVFGNLLIDLSLYHREKATLPSNHYESDLAARYLHPASRIINRHVDYSFPNPNWSDIQNEQQYIPHRVVQYWNDRTPPQSVKDLMHSWSSIPDITYKRFNSQSARTFLRRTFGADYERAFRKACNVAEGADFFRLCYLRHYGGIYADADDRLYGQLHKLLPTGVGLVCYREFFDFLANNVIAAVPEHPAIVLASEMAAEALLVNDHDNTWSKTGPGLLTRAVASYLAEAKPSESEPQKCVAILPDYILRRQVQVHMPLPHKKTQRHWKATNKTGADLKPYFRPKCNGIVT